MAPRLWVALIAVLALLPWVAPSGPAKGPSRRPGEGPVVRVAQGQLRGRRVQRPYAPQHTLYAFEGVPFARPPLGARRFKDPEEPESWTEIKNATTFGPNCVQKYLGDGNVHGEEDCLYLNIYTAAPPESWTTLKCPVIVWIHGGAFVQGSGDTNFARPDPIIRLGLIFVTINYRLGVLGFLNTEDSDAPGNAALKDQTMALRWVQRNIAAFGGDPSNVTIMGESAGAGSVNYHLLSPLSRGLFRRAIAVSGSVVPSWAIVEQPRQKAQALRRRWAAACPDLPEAAIAPCLRRINASELIFHQYDVPREEFENNNTFLPSMESPAAGSAPFLTADPVQLLKEGRFARVPYMTGITTGEGILYLWFFRVLQDPSRWEDVDKRFEDMFFRDMPRGLRTREVVRQVRRFYLGDRSLRNANESVDTLQRFQQMCGDIYFGVGTSTTAELMTKNGGRVYLYQFSRDENYGIIKTAMNASHIPGVTHGDDMAYFFDFIDQTTNEPYPVPASEVPLRERQQQLFANFAKTGNPTPEDSGLLEWPLYSLRNERYLNMDVQLSVSNNFLGERIAFWRKLAKTMESGNVTHHIPNGKKV